MLSLVLTVCSPNSFHGLFFKKKMTQFSSDNLKMVKPDKKPVEINSIKNKMTRERLWQQIKHKKKEEKKERREKKKKAREEFGEEAVPIEVCCFVFHNYPP